MHTEYKFYIQRKKAKNWTLMISMLKCLEESVQMSPVYFEMCQKVKWIDRWKEKWINGWIFEKKKCSKILMVESRQGIMDTHGKILPTLLSMWKYFFKKGAFLASLEFSLYPSTSSKETEVPNFLRSNQSRFKEVSTHWEKATANDKGTAGEKVTRLRSWEH